MSYGSGEWVTVGEGWVTVGVGYGSGGEFGDFLKMKCHFIESRRIFDEFLIPEFIFATFFRRSE